MYRFIALSILVIFVSCQKEVTQSTPTSTQTTSTPTTQVTIDYKLLYGWWIATGLDGLDYKRRYFGSDSSYIEDRTNIPTFGISYRKWWPGTADTIYVSNQETGQPIVPNLAPTKVVINKLTTDSLRLSTGGPSHGYYRQ